MLVLFIKEKVMSQVVKVFLACAIGAGIGSFVALEVAEMFWWVGLFVGGFVGYVSYDWKEIIKAIPKAYRSSANRGFIKKSIECLCFSADCGFWMSIIVGGLCVFCTEPQERGGVISFSLIISMCATAAISGFAVGFYIFLINNRIGEDHVDYIDIKKVCFYTLPFLLVFWHLPRGITFIAKRIPKFSKWFVLGCISVAKEWGSFFGRFFWKLFLLIHCEMRILCGIDATIGAAVGYFAGSAIIGAVSGGIIGVFNYAVVTELCLKRLGYLPIKQNS